MKPVSKLVAALLVASFVAAPAWPQQPAKAPVKEVQAAPAAAAEEEVEPKFIWGILINIAISKLSNFAFETFAKWALTRLTGGTSGLSMSSILDMARNSGAKIGFSSRGATPVLAGADVAPRAAPIVVGNPETPLVADGKKENYQGVHIALMMAEDGGKSFSFRPVNQGFRTGERFKLRVLSTFGGELAIENINPRGERKQVFPPRADQVVTLLPASETLISMDPNQFFEFAGATGREQLVVNVTDPRAVGAAASRNKVYRQDTQYGSNFLQETAGGTYPSIQQAVELVHSAK